MISAFTKQNKVVRLWSQNWGKILIVSFNYLYHLACFTFSKLYIRHHKMEIKPVSVSCFCVTTLQTLRNLKQ